MMTLHSPIAAPLAPRHRGGAGRGRARAAAGFSLVELMVSMTIGLLIVVALSAMYVSSSSGKKSTGRVAEYRTNARYAADILKRNLQHAGFFGLAISSGRKPPAWWITDAARASRSRSRKRFPARTSPRVLGCIPNYLAGSGDVLLVRRAEPTE